jgi:predicted enzyme related to lactoylglutathione lyase
MNLTNVLIGSDDADALAAYYGKLFGNPVMTEGGYSTFVIGSGAITVGPHDQVHGKNQEPGRIIVNIESDDVQGDFKRFQDAGAIVVREPYSFEGTQYWIGTLADPDGNYFQLVSPFDQM